MVNEWDHTPWMMGGGAQHSVNVGRLLAYVAFGGDEGIIGPGDLQVRSAAVPNGTVRVMPGACAILNRGLNISYEAYAARLPLSDTVSITATGSSGGRSDLVVAVVMNPYQDGEPWPAPNQSDVESGAAEFVKTMVIPNVPATTRNVKELNLGYSAIALARIDIPANTGTIQQSMIVDLRKMSQVREKTDRKSARTTVESFAQPNFDYWPAGAAKTVLVPEWATSATMRGIVTGAFRQAGQMNVQLLMDLRLNPGGPYRQSPATVYDVDAATPDVMTFVVATGGVEIPPEWRGREVTFGMYARNMVPGVAVIASQYYGSAYEMSVTFGQEALAPGTGS